MKMSNKGRAHLKTLEGFRSDWYRDVGGVPTIGYGFTGYSKAFRNWWSRHKSESFGTGSISKAEADKALAYILTQEYETYVQSFLGSTKVPQKAFDVMVSVVYNAGPKALTWRWAEYIKAGRYDRAADILETTATTANGKYVSGLVNRRKKEADYLRGIQLDEPKETAQGFWTWLINLLFKRSYVLQTIGRDEELHSK